MKIKMKNVLPIVGSFVFIGILIIVGIYFLYLLPKQEDEKMAFEKQKYQAEQQAVLGDRKYQAELVDWFNDCRDTAHETYMKSWDKDCSDLGLEPSCDLPLLYSLAHDERRVDEEQRCLDAFQVTK